ncbi:MAG: hypothetical protein R6U41_08210 [Desulfosalsimonas sp.]|uniref:hypothetical protein n=1 Tax=Desulfosalsimonas sp. TaxID=3073848 RepID=UPI00397092CB
MDLLVTEAIRFAKKAVAPLNEIGEEQGIRYEKGQVRCPPKFAEVFRRLLGRSGR